PLVIPENEEFKTPGLRSASIKVPSAVPSLTQSSLPCVPSFALKKYLFRKTPRASILLENGPGLISSKSLVPDSVPSVDHNSDPVSFESTAEKRATESSTPN